MNRRALVVVSVLLWVCSGLISVERVEARTLRVLTFNAWLFPDRFYFPSQDHLERLYAMPKFLFEVGADVIGMQEVWDSNYRDTLIQGMQKYGYYAYYRDEPRHFLSYLGQVGNGLLIFSKMKAVSQEVNLLTFSAVTRFDEHLVRKGAIHVTFEFEDFGRIDFFDTHLGVVSVDPQTKAYDQKQLNLLTQQSVELKDFIEKHNERGVRPLVLTGDLNSHPQYWNSQTNQYESRWMPIYAQLTERGLIDTFHLFNPFEPMIYTYDVKKNSYLKDSKYPSEYIDYIFYRDLRKRLKAVRSKIVLNQPAIKGKKGSHLSDHFGVTTEFDY
jgi:endonuclease/exonuclease/phosphatase family metal-dependent hydrolase